MGLFPGHPPRLWFSFHSSLWNGMVGGELKLMGVNSCEVIQLAKGLQRLIPVLVPRRHSGFCHQRCACSFEGV